MLVFTDKGKLKKRIKALEESLSEANLLKKRYKERVEELNKHVTAMDYQQEADEERWAEKLESYEESLKRRDLTIAELKAELNMAGSIYESVNERCTKANKSLEEAGTKITELESENSYLRKELHDAMEELNGCNPSKSPYPTVTINVDVRDTLYKQLAKSLKQANEAFEKRYKKKYEYKQAGTSEYYECATLDELLNELNSTYWIKEADLNSLREAYESLEEIFNEKGKAYATLSFYSIEYGSPIYIMAGIIKEDI